MSLLERTRTFVENLFKDKLSDVYQYHNFRHTVFTVEAVINFIVITDMLQKIQIFMEGNLKLKRGFLLCTAFQGKDKFFTQ